jgi:methylase of polypeptide subunit release factors
MDNLYSSKYNMSLSLPTQILIFSNERKTKYGEINTPFFFINQILSIIPQNNFENPNLKWLDPGAGSGYFTIILFNKLFKGLENAFPSPNERKKHIIENMLYMVEIQEENITTLRDIFGQNANIFHTDFLTWSPHNLSLFDIIIGNPPYNYEGRKKVPTNQKLVKKEDGKTIWIPFVRRSVEILKKGGYLCMIIPSIWMKPDKAKMYDFMTNFNLVKIHTFSNTETNKIFSKQAQTPTCFFLLKKEVKKESTLLFDKDREEYISFMLRENTPIPVFGSGIITKLIPFIEKTGHLKAIKTNSPSKFAKFSQEKTKEFPYKNIKTCILNKLQPEILVNYSNDFQSFYGERKLILAHKMYGFPYLDEIGDWGISQRDNYIISEKDYSLYNLKRIRDFLSTKFALYVYESTRYRMKYLEKYAFLFFPDISQLNDFPEEINDETIADYFNFDQKDRENIQKLHRKNYDFHFSQN